MKVVVTRNIGQEAISIIQSHSEIELVLWPEDRSADRAWLLENVPDSVGLLVTLSDKVDQEVIAKAGPQLKVVSTMSVGYEHVDLAALAKAKVRLGYTPEVLTDAVADVAIMLALMTSRNAAHSLTLVKGGQWPEIGWAPFGLCGPQIGMGPTQKSFTVGFLGMGRIALATLHRLIPFRITRAVYTDSGRGQGISEDHLKQLMAHAQFGSLSSVERVSLDQLAMESDLIFLLAPGGNATQHIIGTTFLRKMKKSAILINPGRGSLVDSLALSQALGEGCLYAAGLDVVDGEPNIAADHPLVLSGKCTLLPHIGSATFETRAAMARLAADNLVAGVRGAKQMRAEYIIHSIPE